MNRLKREPNQPRSVTINRREMGGVAAFDGDDYADVADIRPPRTRADCVDGERPCPWARCRHNLLVDVSANGSIRINHPGVEPEALAETCALDVAERGGMSLDEVAKLMNLTREGARVVQERGLFKLRSTRIVQ